MDQFKFEELRSKDVGKILRVSLIHIPEYKGGRSRLLVVKGRWLTTRVAPAGLALLHPSALLKSVTFLKLATGNRKKSVSSVGHLLLLRLTTKFQLSSIEVQHSKAPLDSPN